MDSHILIYRSRIRNTIVTCNPLQNGLQICLFLKFANHIITTYLISHTPIFTEITTSVSNEGTNIYSITQLLIEQTLTCNVYHTEPIKLFHICTCTEIDCQLIVKKVLLFFFCKIVKEKHRAVFINNIESMLIILADRQCAVLPSYHFIFAFIAYTPVHNV